MSHRIGCEQFVYGKLVGVRGARYELIAKSPGVTAEDASEVYKSFNGYRPSATAIATFQGAYVVKVLASGRIVLLQLARSREKELGRGFFLQEHYVILHGDDVEKGRVKSWLWLLSIPSNPPAFLEYGKLPDHISLNEREITALLNKAIKQVSQNKDFQGSVVTALHYILHSRPVTVSLRKSIFLDYWTWLTALGVLMPDSQVAEMELYIGSSVPHKCIVDVSVVEGESTQEPGYQISGQPGDMLAVDQVRRGYTNLSRRCLKTDDMRLLKELIATVEGIDVHALPTTPTTPYDVLLWMVTMPEVGLQLAWNELNEDELSIDDLQWLWRNSIDSFTEDHAKTFLPILVKHTLNDWKGPDFASLRKLITHMPSVIAEIDIDDDSVSDLLERWISHTEAFSSDESYWAVLLLEQLASIDPTSTIALLVRWTSKDERDDVFDNVLRVLRQLRHESAKEEHYWDIVLALVNRIRHVGDLSSFRTILRLLSVVRDAQPLELFAGLICDEDADPNKRHRYEIVLCDVIRSAEEAGESARGQVVRALLLLVALTKNQDMLVALAIVISQVERDCSVHSSALIEEAIRSVGDQWIFRSNRDEMIASFIFIIGKLGGSQFSRDTLTSLLQEEPSKYTGIARYMQSMLRAQRGDLAISLERLSLLPAPRQLDSLVEYVLSTQRLPFAPTELDRLKCLLMEIPSLDSINLDHQAQLIAVLGNLGAWNISQRILEHQVRSALLCGDIAQSYEKFEHLRQCVEAMKIERLKYRASLIKASSIVSYWRGLSREHKAGFLNWLLMEPLGKAPVIEHTYLFVATSAILEKNRQWLVDDPVVRLRLFAEAMQVVRQWYM